MCQAVVPGFVHISAYRAPENVTCMYRIYAPLATAGLWKAASCPREAAPSPPEIWIKEGGPLKPWYDSDLKLITVRPCVSACTAQCARPCAGADAWSMRHVRPRAGQYCYEGEGLTDASLLLRPSGIYGLQVLTATRLMQSLCSFICIETLLNTPRQMTHSFGTSSLSIFFNSPGAYFNMQIATTVLANFERRNSFRPVRKGPPAKKSHSPTPGLICQFNLPAALLRRHTIPAYGPSSSEALSQYTLSHSNAQPTTCWARRQVLCP